MGVGQAWAAIGILGAFAVAVLGIIFTELRGIRGEIGGLRSDLSALSDRVSTMDGKLDVVVRQAHTHNAA